MAEYLCEEDMSTGEYISRDLALRQLNATCSATSCDNYNGVRCRACAYADAMDFIEAIPAADVQPVVRCKDCIYLNRHDCPMAYIEHQTLQFAAVTPDFYCAKGANNEP